MNSITGEVEYTGRVQRRLVLVLDCVVANEFTDKMSDLMNLQHYVIREKRLTEKEAVVIFFDIVRVIDCLHRVCSDAWSSLTSTWPHLRCHIGLEEGEY